MTFNKSDFWRAFVAGGLIALLALPALKNLGVFGFLAGYGEVIFYLCVGAWFAILPFAASAGLYVVYSIAIPRWPIIYQIGKYGIIGLLNTFLDLGILNFLILMTEIAGGLWFDAFVVISFWGAVTNAFFWNKFWTFNSSGTGEIKKEYIRFFVVSGAVSLINVILMHFLVNVIGPPFSVSPKVWVNIAFLSAIPVSFFGNFFGWKILVFKKTLQNQVVA